MMNPAARVVATDRGEVRGSDEGAVVSFRGIPYAASPVGALRFAAPHPHPGWTGVRAAVRPGPAVPQAPSRLERVMGRRTPDGNENGSLTLNVWSPRTALEENTSRPVLVWFHGGGFTSGSGGWDWYDGARLAELGNVVVVTANYRVGPLGYLRLPHIGADNLGAQDQAAVLRWVRDNIASFGGDPRAVTVGGQSAGAYSALSLAVDPATGGLVNRVLLQSGPWGLPPQSPEQASEAAEEYQRLLGIPRGTEPGQALRELPVEHLLSAYGELAIRLARPGNVAPPMYPVLGGAGIPRAWQHAVRDGALEGKPLLIGTAQEEMTAFFAFEPRIQSLTPKAAIDLLTSQFGREAPEVYQRHADRLPHATPAQVFTALHTDEVFRDGALRLADHHAAGGNATYVYQFDYRPAEDPGHLGATHCGELPFLFGTFDSYPDSPMLGSPSATERALGRTFATAVAEFIAGGSPSDWLPYAPEATVRIRHFG
ncbi:carboxylesterase/lipase family protein [Streptomyces sp. 110]|uniref:Carboxylic ester hydrolase n=1 Tax=Streptomyces endocoffeicus TaxID=2898945 RepID=A0ABS1PH39_9ACTN|nr:carboxylesterase family protein [Streptomyces endocoffeicus]MBL1111325.1 carboxylesterase/lipase family protein [Streptomyces endocoffeicus]